MIPKILFQCYLLVKTMQQLTIILEQKTTVITQVKQVHYKY
jgi:hypothetical protein